MLRAQFVLRRHSKVHQLVAVPDVNTALDRAVREGGRLDAVDHLGVHGLGLGLEIDQTLAQVPDVGIGQVSYRAALGIGGQLAQL